MPLQAVIFDLDGTLVDTLSDIASACNHTLAHAGLPTHSLDAYRRFVGGGARVLVERALPAHALGELDVLLEDFRTHYLAHLIVESTPYPEINTLLTTLTKQNIPMAILSNKPHAMVLKIVDHFFSNIPFVAVQGQKPDIPKKPDPTSVLTISQELGLPPEQIAYVGDSDVDIDTALAAKMRAVGVQWGFRGRAELESRGAEHILETPSDLLQLLA